MRASGLVKNVLTSTDFSQMYYRINLELQKLEQIGAEEMLAKTYTHAFVPLHKLDMETQER
jgi:hypothetical protein